MLADRRTILNGAGAALLLSPLASPLRAAGGGQPLPRSRPGAQKVSAAGLLAFIDAAREAGHELHSVMLARHGHVVAEGWWSPYRRERPHQLYSMMKIYLSVAVGLAVERGLFSLDDPILSIFPDLAPASPSPNLAAMRLRHLLTGSTGHSEAVIAAFRDDGADADGLVRQFLALPVDRTPGTYFAYNGWASTILSAIVARKAGQSTRAFLQRHLFAPLGMGDPLWSPGPPDYPVAACTEDVLRLGLLHLGKGEWRGRRILSREWVAQASIAQVPTASSPVAKMSPDWALGYGYQLWPNRHDTYSINGAAGQYCIVMPHQDAVLAITSETTDMAGLYDLIWRHVLPAMGPVPAAPDRPAEEALARTLGAAALPLPEGAATSPTASRIAGRWYALEANHVAASALAFTFTDRDCLVSLRHSGGRSTVCCGLGRWTEGETDMPGTPPNIVPSSFVRGQQHPVAAACAWRDADRLEMHWRFTVTPHHLRLLFRFDGDGLAAEMAVSLMGKAPPQPLFKGHLA